jgi:hypothetical protein
VVHPTWKELVHIHTSSTDPATAGRTFQLQFLEFPTAAPLQCLYVSMSSNSFHFKVLYIYVTEKSHRETYMLSGDPVSLVEYYAFIKTAI